MSRDTASCRTITAAGSGIDASNIPVLETERLRLRPFSLNDLPSACALWADEQVVRFIGATPRTDDQVWSAIARSFGHWALLGYGFWAIADKVTNAYLGEIGYLESLRDLQPPHDAQWQGVPEAGWALNKSVWGQGFASEALTAVNQWSDQYLQAAHTQCLIDPDHSASLNVAKKRGYQLLRQATLSAQPTLILVRPRRSSTLAS